MLPGFGVPEFLFPTPWAILMSLWQYAGPIANHALQTLSTTMVGFVFAVVVGVGLGLAIGSSRLVYHALYRVLIGFNSDPEVRLRADSRACGSASARCPRS